MAEKRSELAVGGRCTAIRRGRPVVRKNACEVMATSSEHHRLPASSDTNNLALVRFATRLLVERRRRARRKRPG